MCVSEQHGVNPCLSGPFFKHAQSAFDPVGISVHHQQLLSFTFQKQLPRRSRADIAITGHMYDPYIQRMGKDIGIFTAVAEMKQGIEGFPAGLPSSSRGGEVFAIGQRRRMGQSGHVAGLQGQGDIPVAIRHHEDTHGVTVADSDF